MSNYIKIRPTVFNNSWNDYFEIQYLKEIKLILDKISTLRTTKSIYPIQKDILKVYNMLPLENIKVVILGIEPYFDDNNANGLAFGCKTKVNSCLRQIISAITKDYSITPNTDKSLEYLVEQGVFLLNTILTIGKTALSHELIGWQTITTETIRIINAHSTGIFFLLWGNHAFTYEKYINTDNNIVLKAPHPNYATLKNVEWSCNHFKTVNEILKLKNQKEIIWI